MNTGHGSRPHTDRRTRPAPGPIPRYRLPPVEKHELPGGLRVWIVEQHRVPQVYVSFLLMRGASGDPPGKSGLAALAAELLDAGTPGRSALEISETAEFLGTSLSFRGGLDATVGGLLTLKRHLEPSLDLFADALLHPLFPEKEFQRVRSQRLTSLAQQKDRPAAVASAAFMRLLYGRDHPYGVDPAGTIASVGRLTRDDVAGFYAENYSPVGATLIIVGDVLSGEILPLIERRFADWRGDRAQEPASAHSSPRDAPGVFLVDRPGAPQAEIRIGTIALPRNTPHYLPASLMNRALGGQFSSRINMNVRERLGLTYGARSSFLFLKNPGPFVVSGGFTSSRAAEAAGQLFGEIDALHRSGITPAELEFCRQGMVGSFALGFETPFQVAGALQTIALYGLPGDYYDRYLDNLALVTGEEVLEAARITLDSSRMALLVAADAREAGPGLAALGRGDPVLVDDEGTRLSP